MITVDTLLEDTARGEDLDDYGHPSFRRGLDALWASLQNDARLNAIGEAAATSLVRGNLINRLRVTDWHRQHPELAAAPVEEPLFIVGLSRTGTTALSHLLAADSALRSLRGWEARESVPPPIEESYWTDPRYLAAVNAPDTMELINPGFKAIHHDPPEMPFECSTLLAQHFQSLAITTMFNVESFDEWQLVADATQTYAWHKRVLQLLQSRYPGRWQLKTPVHGLYMEALAATYPGARFVVTHRDPVAAVASVCSLARKLTGVFTDADFTGYIARQWPMLAERMVGGVVEFREQHPEAQFYDMPYRALVSDPVGEVTRMYSHFGLELTDRTHQAMVDHVRANPASKHGTHSYSLEEFGLRAEDVRERFTGYLDEYGDYCA